MDRGTEKREIEQSVEAKMGWVLTSRQGRNDVRDGFLGFGVTLLIPTLIVIFFPMAWWLNIIVFMAAAFIVLMVMVAIGTAIDERRISKKQIRRLRQEFTKPTVGEMISYEEALFILYAKKIIYMDCKQLLINFGPEIKVEALIAELNHLEGLSKVVFKMQMKRLRQEALRSGEVDAKNFGIEKIQELKSGLEYDSSQESELTPTSFSQPQTPPPVPHATNLELVDLNLASESEIAKLPRVNLIIAKKIIQSREQLGGFTSFEQMEKEVNLPANTALAIKDHVMFSEVEPKIQSSKGRMVDF